MTSRAESWIAALGRVLSTRLLGVGLLAATALLLFGTVSGDHIAALLLLFVAVRGAFLGIEALRKPVTPQEWEQRRWRTLEELRALPADDLEEAAREEALDGPVTRERLADAMLESMRRSERPPRPRRELACEALGLVAFTLMIPLALELYTSELVSRRSLAQGWTGAATAFACVALYAWPHRWSEREGVEERRALWWWLPFPPALAAVVAGVAFQHPYLNPLREERAKLAADRVLSLRENVEAGRHADWVFGYAQALERSGDLEEAAQYYRGGLHLAPQDEAAHARLRALEQRLAPRRAAIADPRPLAGELAPHAFAQLPFWRGVPARESPPACRLDASLARLDATTVVIVRVGEVPARIVNAVGDVIERELGLPTCLAADGIELPAPTRVRGVVFGRQWGVVSVAEAFFARVGTLPRAPARLLLVTGADIYDGDSNYVFSSTWSWGAVLSYARYERFGTPEQTLEHRTAKQALGALLKSFGLPPSPDPDCVTSYTNGIEQFDAKGNRPNTETFVAFRQRVEAENRQWRALRASGAR
jgi:predicted Zn-dependent protease